MGDTVNFFQANLECGSHRPSGVKPPPTPMGDTGDVYLKLTVIDDVLAQCFI